MSRTTLLAACAAAAVVAPSLHAESVNITIENLSAPGGFALTPFWLSTHDGSFTTFQNGTLATGWDGLIELAEGGDTMPLSDRFAASAAGLAGGTQTTLVQPDAAPVFSPGESASVDLDFSDVMANRYFSFGSMVVPSNDLFVGNDDGMAYELFDAGGNFNGPIEILIFGSDVWDAGSEVNDAFGGAAFSVNGGASVDESELIRPFFTVAGDADYLADFLGTGTADGNSVTSTFGPGDAIARITIVPAPSALLAMSCLGFVGGRRRRP